MLSRRNIFLAYLFIFINIACVIFYCFRNIGSTAELVTVARHCGLLSSPNYTISDNFNLGIDNCSQYFIQDFEKINNTCYFFHMFTDWNNLFAQRTYYFDKEIIQAFTRNNDTNDKYNNINDASDYKQLVIFGAGYDSRAKRFEKYFNNITIFEVDLQITQERKKSLIKSNNLNWPNNVKFVESDFNTNNIQNDLFYKGYKPYLKTVFLSEGLIYFLKKPIFEQTLKFIKENSKSESIFLLDFRNIDENPRLIDRIYSFNTNILLNYLFKEPFLDFHDKYELKNMRW